MQQVLKQQAVTGKRQITAAETEWGYRAPRYRVTLICEERGEDSTVAIQDSAAAASVLRPYFADLDREHFMVLGLDANIELLESIWSRLAHYPWP